jgi:regulator of sirC expression with transglutaminase-like and TPR domain
MIRPVVCSRAAFDLFDRQLGQIESTPALVRGAIAISLHALDDVDLEHVESYFRSLADRVRGRVHGRQVQARLAHLHDVLFEEEGFTGNVTDYYSPLNSYLPAVVESRLGIPITLSLVYKAVATQLNLEVVGLNVPSHFLIEVRAGNDRLIVDPFLRGQLVTVEEVVARLGSPSPLIARFVRSGCLPVATHKQWLARMLANLQHFFSNSGRTDDFAAMTELQQLLNYSSEHPLSGR